MSTENKGIIETVTDYIADTANAIGEWAGATTAEAEHKTKAEGHREVRDQEWNKATNSNESLTERAKGVGKAAKHEVKSLSEDAKKEKEKQKAEHAKDKLTGNDTKSQVKKEAENAKDAVEGNNESMIEKVENYVSETVEAVGDWMSATSKEAQHKTKEEGHKAARKAEWEHAKSENSPSSAVDAVKDGAKELKEGLQKEYYDQKADTAAERM